jgi:acetyl esterase/lipase
MWPATVGRTSLRKYVEAHLPPPLDPRDPDISPLYADLPGLPPAIAVGTDDPLLDDSLFLSARWIAAGNPAELAIYPRARAHGFTLLPVPEATRPTPASNRSW